MITGARRVGKKVCGEDRTSHLSSRGFTLLEALISIAILGTILSFVYLSFFTAFNAKSYVERRNEVYQTGMQIMAHLKRELSSAYLDINPAGLISPYTYFIGIKDEWDGNPMDRLYFTTLSHVNIPVGNQVQGSDYAAIAYDTQIDEGKNKVYLVHREQPFFVAEPLTQGPGFIITRSAVSIAFYFFDANTKQWTDQWDTRLQGMNHLPYAVLIQLILKDRNGVDVPFREIVRLRMGP